MHNEVNGPRGARRPAVARRAIATVAASATLGAAIAMMTAGAASAAPSRHGSHPENGKVTLCHARPPATAKNGWVQITVSTNAVTHAGHGNHADDIIPAFTYYVRGAEHHYPGKNLTSMFDGRSGQDVLAAGCTTPTAGSGARASHRSSSERAHGQRRRHRATAAASQHAPRQQQRQRPHQHASQHQQQAPRLSAHRNAKVTLCHATPPATAKNGWVQITVSTNAVTHAGHGNHADDIIPAFTYYVRGTELSYPGKNLATVFDGVTGQQLLSTGCAVPAGAGSSATDQRSPHLAVASGDRRNVVTRRHDAARHASARVMSNSAGTSRAAAQAGSAPRAGAVDAAAGVHATGPTSEADAAARTGAPQAPAGADARGLAVGDTGDHGSAAPSSMGVTAAVIGGALAALLALAALAYRRRRSNGAGA